MRWLNVPVLGLAWLAAVQAAAQPQDTVILKNGDEHLGRVTVSEFAISTAYGRFVLPRALVAEITATGGAHVVRTVDGGRLSGRVELGEMLIERTAFAPLSASFADVAEMQLAPIGTPLPAAPDRIELSNGDVLWGQVPVPHIVLDTAVGPRRVAREELAVLDVALIEKELRGRVTPRGVKTRVPVTLAEQTFEVRIASGQTIAIPVAQITSVRFDAALLAPSAPAVLRDRLRAGGLGPELVVIPPGEFLRGDTRGDGDPDERPVTAVRIARSLALGRYEVTFEEYDSFCEATGRAKPSDEGWGRGRRPVVNVSWRDAKAYAQWLSEQSEARYRLPTSAEWEYAARAGGQTRYPWGDELGRDRANCAGCGSPWDGVAVAPVGRFEPNAFGLYDVAGNVWEWVEDCWYPGYENAPRDGSAYTAGGECDKRVVRGGSWSTPPAELRSANRWRDFNVRASDDIGFRIARDL